MVHEAQFVFQLVEETPFLLLKVNCVGLDSEVPSYSRSQINLNSIGTRYLVNKETRRIFKDRLPFIFAQRKVVFVLHEHAALVKPVVQRLILCKYRWLVVEPSRNSMILRLCIRY